LSVWSRKAVSGPCPAWHRLQTRLETHAIQNVSALLGGSDIEKFNACPPGHSNVARKVADLSHLRKGRLERKKVSVGTPRFRRTEETRLQLERHGRVFVDKNQAFIFHYGLYLLLIGHDETVEDPYKEERPAQSETIDAYRGMRGKFNVPECPKDVLTPMCSSTVPVKVSQ
jgi:hypothetical protein